MKEPLEKQQGNEALWRSIFESGQPDLLKLIRFHRKLPAKPRCRLCLVPFKGIGGWYMRLRGKGPNSRNPNFCNACDKFIESHPGGAEVELSLLYVDIRQSTEFADGHTPAEVSQRINSFLNQAIGVITEHDGFINAFYGDCIVASWPPGFCGQNHAVKALVAAEALVRDRQLVTAEGESIPVGVGINSGKMYVSTVSALKGTFRDVSVFGSEVNRTARLASAASAGEVLGSENLLLSAGQDPSLYPKQSMALKGFSEPVDVYRIA